MAHIRRLGKPGAFRYQVRWTDPNHVEHGKIFARKIDAENELTSLTHSVLSGTYVDPSAGRETFAHYAETWRAGLRQRGSTRRNQEMKLRRHVYPVIGSMPLAQIRPSDVRGLRASLTCADSTAAVIMGLVRSALSAAVIDRVIAANPTDGMKFAGKSKLVVPMWPAQVRAMFDAVPSRYYAMVMLGATSGLRIGELCGLPLNRFDALRRAVTVDQQVSVQAYADGPIISPPKSAASRRTVPIPQQTVEAIARHLARYGPAVLDDGAELVFSNERGGLVRPAVFRRNAWRTALRGAGLPESVVPHDLRHFYASALIANGESVTTVQRRLGHESAKTTLDTYSHLWADSDDRTRDAITAALNEIVTDDQGNEVTGT